MQKGQVWVNSVHIKSIHTKERRLGHKTRSPVSVSIIPRPVCSAKTPEPLFLICLKEGQKVNFEIELQETKEKGLTHKSQFPSFLSPHCSILTMLYIK